MAAFLQHGLEESGVILSGMFGNQPPKKAKFCQGFRNETVLLNQKVIKRCHEFRKAPLSKGFTELSPGNKKGLEQGSSL